MTNDGGNWLDERRKSGSFKGIDSKEVRVLVGFCFVLPHEEI